MIQILIHRGKFICLVAQSLMSVKKILCISLYLSALKKKGVVYHCHFLVHQGAIKRMIRVVQDGLYSL